jgi:hypothetical protein
MTTAAADEDIYKTLNTKEVFILRDALLKADSLFQGPNQILFLTAEKKVTDFADGATMLLNGVCLNKFLTSLQIALPKHAWLFETDVDVKNTEFVATDVDADLAQRDLYRVLSYCSTGEAADMIATFEPQKGMDTIRALSAWETERAEELRNHLKKHITTIVEEGFPSDKAPRAHINCLMFYVTVYNELSDGSQIGDPEKRTYLYDLAMNCKNLNIYSSLKVLKQNDNKTFIAISLLDLTTKLNTYFLDHSKSPGSKTVGSKSFQQEKKVSEHTETNDSTVSQAKVDVDRLGKKAVKNLVESLSKKHDKKFYSQAQIEQIENKAVKAYKSKQPSSSNQTSTFKTGPGTKFDKKCSICKDKRGWDWTTHSTSEHKEFPSKTSNESNWRSFH